MCAFFKTFVFFGIDTKIFTVSVEDWNGLRITDATGHHKGGHYSVPCTCVFGGFAKF
jgi:hypothetical protein